MSVGDSRKYEVLYAANHTNYMLYTHFAPKGIRTPNRPVRSRVLYPIELPVPKSLSLNFIICFELHPPCRTIIQTPQAYSSWRRFP